MTPPVETAEELFARLADVLRGHNDRAEKAKRLTDILRAHGGYRWVGLYDVLPAQREISLIAYSGPRAPAFHGFPISKGLTGAAVRSKTIINVGDVRSDRRYLASSDNTQSELIVPVIDPASGEVCGTLDVESDRADAFSADDEQFFQSCATTMLPLWREGMAAAQNGGVPTLIPGPTRIKAAGTKPKLIDEYIGRVNSGTASVSVAHMRSPAGWVEPGQTPDFDEYTYVLRGMLRVKHSAGELDVHAGQAVICHKGEWIQYSTPEADGAEYIAICCPAFSMETVHRDE